MCQINYNLSIKKISNTDRQALLLSRMGKDESRCTLHYSHSRKTLFMAVPYGMAATKAGETVNKMHSLYKSVADSIVPVALPRGVC